jgi:hypothetical protein
MEDPLKTIAMEFQRRADTRMVLRFLPGAEVNELAKSGRAQCDVVLCMPAEKDSKTAVSSLRGATTVAWEHPGGIPVWAARITKHPHPPAGSASGGETGLSEMAKMARTPRLRYLKDVDHVTYAHR